MLHRVHRFLALVAALCAGLMSSAAAVPARPHYRRGGALLPIAGGSPEALSFQGLSTSYPVLSSTVGTSITLDSSMCGKRLYMNVDAVVLTLPATVAGYSYEIVNDGADGAVLVAISPNASDAIAGAGLTAVDNKDLLNTKATAHRGDFVRIVGDGGGGWIVQAMAGTWAKEA